MTTVSSLALALVGASTSLDSICLREASYRPRRRLRLTFTSGRCYEYRGVPARVYRELTEAASPGRYCNAEIRNRYSASEKPVRAPEPRLYQLRRCSQAVMSALLNPTICWRQNPTPGISDIQIRDSTHEETE